MTTHPAIIGSFDLPPSKRDVGNPFEQFAPSVAGGKTYKAVSPSDYIGTSRGRGKDSKRTSWDEVGQPGWDEDDERVTDEERAFAAYMASKPGTSQASTLIEAWKREYYA